jgi:hypothetical protein
VKFGITLHAEDRRGAVRFCGELASALRRLLGSTGV